MTRRDANDSNRRRSLLSRGATDTAPQADAGRTRRGPAREGLLSLRAEPRADGNGASDRGWQTDRDTSPGRTGSLLDDIVAPRPLDRMPRARNQRFSSGLSREGGQSGERGQDQAPADQPAPARPDDHTTMAGQQPQEAWKPLIDPLAVIGGILGSGRIIVLTTLAGAALGVMVALGTPKHYVSTAEIIVDPRDIKIGERELTAGGLPSDATLAIIENQVRVMYSGRVLGDVVNALDLARDSEFNGQGGGISLRGMISSLRSLVSGRGSGAADGDRARALAIENLAESLDISRGDKTFVIYVSARTKNPEKSARVANTLVDVYREAAGQLQSDTAGRAETEITSRLAELRKGVFAAEQAVEAYKAENDLVDAQGRLISDDQIVKINDQLSNARAKTIELQARATSARDVDPDAAATASLPEYVNSAVLAELRSQYARLSQQADALAVRLGPRHPERQAVDAQLAGARRQIAAELRRIVASIQVELKRAVEQEQQLGARLAQAKARQAAVSDRLVELRELERAAAAERAVYENYLLRARDAAEQKGLNTANVSIISPATPALLPTGPSRSMIAVVFTMLGFVAGVGLGALRGVMAAFGGRAAIMPRASRLQARRSGPEEGPLPPPPGQGRMKRRTPQPDESPDRINDAPAPQPAWAAAATALLRERTGQRMPAAPDPGPVQPPHPASAPAEGQSVPRDTEHLPSGWQAAPSAPSGPSQAMAPAYQQVAAPGIPGSPAGWAGYPASGWPAAPCHGAPPPAWPAAGQIMPSAPVPAMPGAHWSGYGQVGMPPVPPQAYWHWPHAMPPAAPPVHPGAYDVPYPAPAQPVMPAPPGPLNQQGHDPSVDAEVRQLRAALQTLRHRVESASAGRRRRAS